MRIAYVVNKYPSISHTFVRREIEGLEQLGAHVERFSLRPIEDAALPDAKDKAELARTEALLGRGPRGLLPAVTRMAAKRPDRFARAQALTLRIGQSSERGLLRHFGYLAEACLLVERVEALGITHVHAHFGTNSVAVAMLAHELGAPGYSFTVHGPEEFDKPDLIALREKIARSRFVVGVSSFGRSQLYRYTNIKEWDKVHVVRCGVDESYVARTPTPVPAVPRFVSVGRICEQKGQLLLVEAAAKLKQRGRNFELVLVGDGEMRADVEALIAREQLQKHVRITGWASGDEVQREIEGARVFVLPSFAEGLPVVIMEALGSGRPVISTYIAGIPELVEHGTCGWLVPAGSIDHVAEAMESALATSEAKLQEMGRVGHERVCAMHDSRSNAERLFSLFQRYTK